MSAGAPVLLAGLEAHLLELDLLWELREANVHSETWTLDDLQSVESRADAHLDGLRIGGADGLRLARAALGSGEPGAAAAGAHLLLASREADTVLVALEAAEPATALALCSALRLGEKTFDDDRLRALAGRAGDAVAAGACDVLAFRGEKPPRPLDPLACSTDATAQALALSALGRLEEPFAEATLRAALESEEVDVRLAALRAAARGGAPRLAEICRAALASRAPTALEAVEFLGWLALPDDLARLGDALADPAIGPAAARALGHAGWPEVVPLLLESLGDTALAPAASGAFVAVTGAEELLQRAPVREGDEFAPDDPIVDPERARSFWRALSRRLEPGRRYFHGALLPTSASAAFAALPLARRLGVYLGARARRDGGFARLELQRRAAEQRG